MTAEQKLREWLRIIYQTRKECGCEIYSGQFDDLEMSHAELDHAVGVALTRGWLASVDQVGSGLWCVLPGVLAKDPPDIIQKRPRAMYAALDERGRIPLAELGRIVWGRPVDNGTIYKCAQRLEKLLAQHDPHGPRVETIGGFVNLLVNQ